MELKPGKGILRKFDANEGNCVDAKPVFPLSPAFLTILQVAVTNFSPASCLPLVSPGLLIFYLPTRYVPNVISLI